MVVVVMLEKSYTVVDVAVVTDVITTVELS
jgi:hypothetical protein